MTKAKSLPIRRQQFQSEAFLAFLADNGAEVCMPTNPYEVVRYRAYTQGVTKVQTHIVYAKENGLLTFTGKSKDHYGAFLAGERIPGMFVSQFEKCQSRDRNPGATGQGQSARRRRKVLARDGDECWFCGLAMGDDMTLEHLVPKSKDGGNSIENFALAHAACNNAAADMPLIKKIELRAQMRAGLVTP